MKSERFQVFNVLVLRVIAMICMVLDHVGFFLTANYSGSSTQYNVGFIFRIIGRIAYPIFALLLAEGMRKTHNPLKYILRLGILFVICTGGMGLIEVLSKPILGHQESTAANATTDLFFAALFLYCINLKGAKKLFAILPLAFVLLCFGVYTFENANDVSVVWFPLWARCDYDLLGFCYIIGFYFAYSIANLASKPACKANDIEFDAFKETSMYRGLVNVASIGIFVIISVLFWGLSYIEVEGTHWFMEGLCYMDSHKGLVNLQTYALLALPLIYMYNGKRGPDSKWWRVVSYAFFPVHLIIIFLIFSLI